MLGWAGGCPLVPQDGSLAIVTRSIALLQEGGIGTNHRLQEGLADIAEEGRDPWVLVERISDEDEDEAVTLLDERECKLHRRRYSPPATVSPTVDQRIGKSAGRERGRHLEVIWRG